MADIMRGADIPFMIKNFPVGATIVRLDFAQQNKIIVTKTTDDFTYDAETGKYNALITQAEALRFDDKHKIDIQLSYHNNGHATRTRISSASPDKIIYEGEI